jgi:hypothetical protein
VPLFGIAIFFGAGGKENARGKDRDNDGDDEKRGSNAHSDGLLADSRIAKNSYQLSVVRKTVNQ